MNGTVVRGVKVRVNSGRRGGGGGGGGERSSRRATNCGADGVPLTLQ